MITFLLLWAIADKQDETNRLLRITPAQRRAEEQTEIRFLLALIVLLLIIILSYVLYCHWFYH